MLHALSPRTVAQYALVRIYKYLTYSRAISSQPESSKGVATITVIVKVSQLLPPQITVLHVHVQSLVIV